MDLKSYMKPTEKMSPRKAMASCPTKGMGSMAGGGMKMAGQKGKKKKKKMTY